MNQNQNKIIIPQNLKAEKFSQSNDVSEEENYSKTREKVLNNLKFFNGVPEIVKNLNPDAVYKIVLQPEGGKLFKDAAGNIQGVFYKNGKIVEHAKFKAVGPNLLKAATAIATQALLIHIAVQLNRVEKKIDRIIDELHNDRISEIQTGIDLYEQAISMKSIEKRDGQLNNAIQSLTTGLNKSMRSLKIQIGEIPDAENGFFDNFLKKKSDIVAEKYRPAEETFLACIAGIKTLSECYIALDEGDAGLGALSKYIKELNSNNIKDVAKKARILPKKGQFLPEESWKAFAENAPQLLKAQESLIYDTIDVIEIEVKPKELLEMQ